MAALYDFADQPVPFSYLHMLNLVTWVREPKAWVMFA